MPNGAQALIRTLVDAGVTTCFTNPGTSEMHFVAALDSVPEMRAILTLFEGVATGAADGYARMADAPAATLLHLGPGLGNGLANLHNARKARVPVVNIVGDHATYHTQYDAPLQSDIETVARNVSTWVRTSRTTEELPRDAVEAIAAAIGPPGQVATLIVPADVSWNDGARAGRSARAGGVTAGRPARPSRPSRRQSGAAAGPRSCSEAGRCAHRGCSLPRRIAAATGTKLFAERIPTRLERGAGLPAVERLAYWPSSSRVQLAGLEHLILADARRSRTRSSPTRARTAPWSRAVARCTSSSPPDRRRAREPRAVGRGARRRAAPSPRCKQRSRPPRPDGPLTAEKVCQAIGAILPEGAIVSDEALTSGADPGRQHRGGSQARLAHA